MKPRTSASDEYPLILIFPSGSMYPTSIYLGPNVPIIGSTLRPKYILSGYMDPKGRNIVLVVVAVAMLRIRELPADEADFLLL